jgi:cytochrome P450
MSMHNQQENAMTSEHNPALRCPIEHMRTPDKFNPFTPEFHADPHGMYQSAQAEQPVFFSPVLNMYVVTRYDDLKTVMRDVETYASGGAFSAGAMVNPIALEALGGLNHPIYQYSLVNADPPTHTRFRNNFQRAFTPRKVALLEPQIRELTHQLLAELREHKRLEVIKSFCDQLPLLTICRLMGVPDAEAPNIKRWSTDYIRAQMPGWTPEEQLHIAQSIQEYYAYLLELVRHYERQLSEGATGENLTSKNLTSENLTSENLISTALEARLTGEDVLSNEEIAGLCCNLIFAGHETTAALLANTLQSVLGQREMWDYFCKHPERSSAAVDELVRHGGPAYGLYRRTTRETTLGAITIPEGALVFISYFAANHDPAQFPEPQQLDFRRENAANHFTLGHGIHYCIGAPLAKLEVRLVLEELARTYPSLRLEPNQTLMPIPSYLIRSVQEMVLEID